MTHMYQACTFLASLGSRARVGAVWWGAMSKMMVILRMPCDDFRIANNGTDPFP